MIARGRLWATPRQQSAMQRSWAFSNSMSSGCSLKEASDSACGPLPTVINGWRRRCVILRRRRIVPRRRRVVGRRWWPVAISVCRGCRRSRNRSTDAEADETTDNCWRDVIACRRRWGEHHDRAEQSSDDQRGSTTHGSTRLQWRTQRHFAHLTDHSQLARPSPVVGRVSRRPPRFQAWLDLVCPRGLNVAGNREEGQPRHFRGLS